MDNENIDQRLNPLLFPSESGSLYLYINSLFITLILVAYLRVAYLNSLNTVYGVKLELSIFIIGVFLFVIFRISKSIFSLVFSENIPSVLENKIKSYFGGRADSVRFLLTKNNDFLARNYLNTNVCFIPILYVPLLIQELERLPLRPKYTILVAHEIGHLYSGDTKKYQLSSTLGALAIWSSIAILLTAWPATYGAKIFILGGICFVATIILFLIYHIIRIREYYADYTASYLVGEDVYRQFLEDMVNREKYVKYHRFYKLTHPMFFARLHVFDRITHIFDYSHLKIIQGSLLVFSMTVASYILLKKTALVNGGYLAGLASLFLVYYLSIRIYSVPVIVASITGKIDIKQCIYKALELCFILYILTASLLGLWAVLYNIFPNDFYPMTEGLQVYYFVETGVQIWEALFFFPLGTILIHICYWWGSRKYLCYSGNKYPSRLFFLKSTVWLGIIGLFLFAAIISYLDVFDPASEQGALNILIVTTIIYLLPALYLMHRWKKHVAKESAKWGCDPEPRTAVFLEHEWSYIGRLRFSRKYLSIINT